MGHSRLVAVLMTSSLLLLVDGANAQEPVQSSRPISVGLGGGVSVPVGDAKDAFKNGFNGHGFVRFNLGGLPISPRIDFTYQRFDFKDIEFAAPVDGNTQIFGGLANLTYSLAAGPVSPYIVAGVGLYNIRTDFQSSSLMEEDSQTKFGINGGAGLIIRLGAISAYLEGRIANIYTDRGAIDTKDIQVVPITFGLVF